MRQLRDEIREWVKLWRSHGLDIEAKLSERECEIVDLVTLQNYNLNHPQISAILGNKQTKSSQFLMKTAITKLTQGWYWYRRDIAIAQKYKLWMTMLIIQDKLISNLVCDYLIAEYWMVERAKSLTIDELPLSKRVKKYLIVNKKLRTFADVWRVYEEIASLNRSYTDVPEEIDLLWFEFL